MKRLLTVLIAAAVVLTAYPAFAMILGSPHDFTGQAGAGTYVYGTCDTCHVPHAAKERKRLWNNVTGITIGGTPWGSTTKGIGLLCGSCHYGNAFTVANIGGRPADNMANLAYAATSHGDNLGVLEGTAAGDLNDTAGAAPDATLPYTQTASNTIECTSCHNPHQDGGPGGEASPSTGIRPFLRADTGVTDISDFCAECHKSRVNNPVNSLSTNDYQNGDPTGAATASMSDFTRNHPVNVLYGDDPSNGIGWFKNQPAGGPLTTVVYGKNATNNALIGWSLGGKMQNTDGSIPSTAYTENAGSTPDANNVLGGTSQGAQQIGCMTCHSIHKPGDSNGYVGSDAGLSTGTGSYQALWLLAVGNSGQGGDYRSDLCETCHGQAISTSATTWDTRAGGVAPSTTGGYDHPIDGPIAGTYLTTFITAWSMETNGNTTFGLNSLRTRAERVPAGTSATWPAGNMGSATPQIICTSCHSAHHAGSRLRRMNGDVNDWCKSCHPSVSPLGHHSNHANDYLSVLVCSNCHTDVPALSGGTYTVNGVAETSSGLAHNGFVYYNLGGDNMGSTPLATNTNGVTVSEPSTQLANGSGCSYCHAIAKEQITYPNTQSATNPGYAVPPVNRLGDVTNSYQVNHYLGQFDTNAKSGVSINVKTGAWNSYQMLPNHKGEQRDYSKFGNSTGIGKRAAGWLLTCESCHSILGNIGREAPGQGAPILAGISSGWENNLLLEDYQDDSYYGNGAASDPTSTTATAGVNAGNGITWATQANALSVGSGLCIACHNQGGAQYNQGAANGTVPDYAIQDPTVAPLNMHPMTGWSITRAQDAGRTTGNGFFLTTDQDGTTDDLSYANNPQLTTGGAYGTTGAPAKKTGGSVGLGAGEGAVSYPVTPGSLHTSNGDPLTYSGAMDCDSCHRPHNAPSGAWLPASEIKTRTLSSSAIGNGAVDTTVTGAVGVPVILEYANTAQGTTADNTGTLCEQCHSY